MTIFQKKQVAIQWIFAFAAANSNFQGAYFSGSILDYPDHWEHSPTSDVDIMVVLQNPLPKLGKILENDVLLEITFLTWDQLSSVEQVLSAYHFAGSFRRNSIISDPTGRLTALYQTISTQFAVKKWVQARCRDAYTKIENGLLSYSIDLPFHDLVTRWLFPTGITTHVILVAGLKNPTVRLRYLSARNVLQEYGHTSFYTKLIQLLGCHTMTTNEVDHHITELENVFDAAAAVSKTPFAFSSDISKLSRPVAIDGSRNLVAAGNHHEAIFWITATFARCHAILAADAPEQQEFYLPAFQQLLSSLGIETIQDFSRRAKETLAILPELWGIAELIMTANPDITIIRRENNANTTII